MHIGIGNQVLEYYVGEKAAGYREISSELQCNTTIILLEQDVMARKTLLGRHYELNIWDKGKQIHPFNYSVILYVDVFGKSETRYFAWLNRYSI